MSGFARFGRWPATLGGPRTMYGRSGPSVVPPLRIVAGRPQTSRTGSVTTGTRFETRVRIHFPVDATDVQFLFPTYWLQLGVPTPCPNNFTITAALERDAAVSPILFAGASSRLAVPASERLIYSDARASVAAGQYYLRVGAEVTLGQQVPAGLGVAPVDAAQDQCTVCNGAASQVLATGAMVNTGSYSIPSGGSYGAIAVIGRTASPQLSCVLLGDSIVDQGGPLDAFGNVGWLACALHARGVAYSKLSVSSNRASWSRSTQQLANFEIAQYATHAILNFGRNDLTAALNDIRIRDDIEEMAIAFREMGVTVVPATITPYTSGTYSTTAGQTIGSGNLSRNNVNAWYAADPDGLFASPIIDTNTAVESVSDPGKWNPNFTADGIHPNPAVAGTSMIAVADAAIATWVQPAEPAPEPPIGPLFDALFTAADSRFELLAPSDYTVTGASLVSWIDRQDPTHTLTQATAGNRPSAPAVVPGQLNGGLAVAFDEAFAQYLVSNRPSSAWRHLHDCTGCTVVVFGVFPGTPGTFPDYILSTHTGSVGNVGCYIDVGASAFVRLLVGNTSVSLANLNGSHAPADVGNVLSFVVDSAYPRFELRARNKLLNGYDGAVGAPATGNPAATLHIGRQGVGTGYLLAKLAGIAIFKRRLSLDERVIVRKYAKALYNIDPA